MRKTAEAFVVVSLITFAFVAIVTLSSVVVVTAFVNGGVILGVIALWMVLVLLTAIALIVIED